MRFVQFFSTNFKNSKQKFQLLPGKTILSWEQILALK